MLAGGGGPAYGEGVRTLWTRLEIGAPAGLVWELLTDVRRWPEWGPTVRRAELDDGAVLLHAGATGRVWGPAGPPLPFRVSAHDEGRRWRWEVAGIGATDHAVEALGARRCRLGFGVPWPAAPYLAVCRVAAARIRRLAEAGPGGEPGSTG